MIIPDGRQGGRAPRLRPSSSPFGGLVEHQLRDPEIEHLGRGATVRQQDVLRLQVAVQHAFAVRGADGGAHRRQDAHRLVGVQPALALEHVPEILAVDELHDEVGAAVGKRAVVVDRDDRGMLQPRDDLRLAPEPAPGLGVAEQLGAHDLQRDEAIEPHVARPVHGAHPAAPEELLDPVLVVHRPRHRRHGPHRGAVRRTLRRRRRSSQRPQRGHSIIGSIGGAAAVTIRVRSLSSCSLAADAPPQPHDVESERHLRGDARQQLAIVGGVGFFGTALAERDHAMSARSWPTTGTSSTAPVHSSHSRSSAAAAAPVTADRSARSRAARRTTGASTPDRPRAAATRRCRAAR